MIIGADAADDRAVLGTTANLYASYGLRRVYYSAYSPIPDAALLLPPAAPPLVREHRLYQADWLLRFYGFELDEIMAGGEDGNLDLGIDPKLAWALKHRERFPVDVNRAPREMLLRVPGLGAKTVDRMLSRPAAPQHPQRRPGPAAAAAGEAAALPGHRRPPAARRAAGPRRPAPDRRAAHRLRRAGPAGAAGAAMSDGVGILLPGQADFGAWRQQARRLLAAGVAAGAGGVARRRRPARPVRRRAAARPRPRR